MIVRIVTYGVESMEAVEQWHRNRADEVEEVTGLERVDFIRKDTKSRAGAIMYFESAADLQHYKSSQRLEWLRETIREDWAAGTQPAQDAVYRVMEVPEAASSGRWAMASSTHRAAGGDHETAQTDRSAA